MIEISTDATEFCTDTDYCIDVDYRTTQIECSSQRGIHLGLARMSGEYGVVCKV